MNSHCSIILLLYYVQTPANNSIDEWYQRQTVRQQQVKESLSRIPRILPSVTRAPPSKWFIYLFFVHPSNNNNKKKTRPRKKKKNKNELPCEILFWIRFVYTTSITDNGSTVKATAMKRESNKTHLFAYCGKQEEKTTTTTTTSTETKETGTWSNQGPGFLLFFLIHSIPFLSFYFFFLVFFYFFYFFHC